MQGHAHRCGGRPSRLVPLFLALGFLLAAAAPLGELVVTGKILYGAGQAARAAGTVDIVSVYNQNPAYMRMKAQGLSENDSRGKALFEIAQKWANKALATVARDHGLDVITVPGGVQGGDRPAPDLTQQVIDELPFYYVEGNVLHGSVAGARSIAEVDSQAVLSAIPAYAEWLGLDENDARWHILRKSYLDSFNKALTRTVRDQGLEAVVERGGVTSRLGAVLDVTAAVIQALTA